MAAFWTEQDYDDHELVELVRDRASGLTAVIAIHSTHCGPGGGGVRFWHYADPADAMRDALRLSRGMSYKNAMAGLPAGGAKGVILADPARTRTPAMLAAFGDAIEALGGRYVTAEDVGMSEADMTAIGERTRHVSGLPVAAGRAGGDPGPYTARGIFLGIGAAVAHKLQRESLAGVHVAIQGTGSVGGAVARLLAAQGAQLTLADIDSARAQRLADQIGGKVVPADAIMAVDCDVFSPNALGAILDDEGIGALKAAIVAGGANNQLARAHHGAMLAARGILYAPDYVINAGGIINVTIEYVARQRGEAGSLDEVNRLIAAIPGRLQAIWQESDRTGESSDAIADRMARRLIGR
jgi:leucine dehydrogenase